MQLITADWFNGIFQALSACIAGLVLWQAVQIKHNQNVQKHNNTWNEFNKLILSEQNLSIFNDFIFENRPEKYCPKNRVNWIIFCWMNVLEGIILDMKNNSMPFERGYDILIDQANLIKKRSSYMHDLMTDRGYGSELIKLFYSYSQTGSADDFKGKLRDICSNSLFKAVGIK